MGRADVTFAIALAFHASAVGHMVQRTFLTMIPHEEVGHAITGWFCGFVAVPGAMEDALIPEGAQRDRLGVVALALAAVAAVGWRRDRMVVVGIAVALGVLAFLGTTCARDTMPTSP